MMHGNGHSVQQIWVLGASIVLIMLWRSMIFGRLWAWSMEHVPIVPPPSNYQKRR